MVSAQDGTATLCGFHDLESTGGISAQMGIMTPENSVYQGWHVQVPYHAQHSQPFAYTNWCPGGGEAPRWNDVMSSDGGGTPMQSPVMQQQFTPGPPQAPQIGPQVTLTQLPYAHELEGKVVLFFPETLHFDHPGQSFVAIFPTLLDDGAQTTEPASVLQHVMRRSNRRNTGRNRNFQNNYEAESTRRRRQHDHIDVNSFYSAEGSAAACVAIHAGAEARRRHVDALKGCAIQLVGEPFASAVICTIINSMPDEHLSVFLASELQEGLVDAVKKSSADNFILALLNREQSWPLGFETRLADALTPLVQPLPKQSRIGNALKRGLQLQPPKRTLSSRLAFACCSLMDKLAQSDSSGLLETSLIAGHVTVARSIVASLVAVKMLVCDDAGARLLGRAASMAPELREELLCQVQRLPIAQQLSFPQPLREALCWRASDPVAAGNSK